MQRSVPPHEIFQALAHPARLRVVRELSEAPERCVCELVQACGLGWSTVSRHLSVLRQAGVISDEKRGQQVYYRLEMACVVRFLDCLETPELVPAEWQGKGLCYP